jgi:hypothetical protein
MTFIESIQFWAAKALFELGMVVGLVLLLVLFLGFLDFLYWRKK